MSRNTQSISRPKAVASVLAAALGTAVPAAAWTPATQVTIAQEAARLAPPDLARQIDKHPRQLQAGAVAPFTDSEAEAHFKNPDGAGTLDSVVAAEVERAVAAITTHRPFAEIVHQLGVVSHYAADANNPLNASAGDAAEARYFVDYLQYVETALPRFPLIFYGLEPALDGRQGVSALVSGALDRSRQLYPLVGQEYRRIDFRSGVDGFDDRSTAFGVASLAFSHAVNDAALLMRYIWLRAGGADHRGSIPVSGERLLRLPRATTTR